MAERSEAHNTVRGKRVAARSRKQIFSIWARARGRHARDRAGSLRAWRTSVDRPPPSARLDVCYFYISNPCSRRNNLFLPSIRLAGLCVHCETENFVRQRCCYAAGVARPLAKSFVVPRCRGRRRGGGVRHRGREAAGGRTEVATRRGVGGWNDRIPRA